MSDACQSSTSENIIGVLPSLRYRFSPSPSIKFWNRTFRDPALGKLSYHHGSWAAAPFVKPTSTQCDSLVFKTKRGHTSRPWLGFQATRWKSFCNSLPTNCNVSHRHPLGLLAHDLIPDPFTGTNENEVQWVGDQTWVYQCSFTLPSTQIDKFQHSSLIFKGLDTFAAAMLDDREILYSDNMFISHQVDVAELLRAREEHVLELVLHSAI